MDARISKTFEESGQNIRENIPPVKVNTPKIDDPLVDKMRRWLLIGLSALVGGGAAILVVRSLLKKFL